MKTKIALAAGAPKKTAEKMQKDQESYLLEHFKALFGKPEKVGMTSSKDAKSITWNKSEVQLYMHTNGKVGLYLSVTGMPHLEFDEISFGAAKKKIASWSRKAVTEQEKEAKEIAKTIAKAKAFAKAFAG